MELDQAGLSRPLLRLRLWTNQVLLLLLLLCSLPCSLLISLGSRRWNNDIRERLYRIKNRATANAVDMTEWAKKKAVADGHPEIVSFINILGEILQREINSYPAYRELSIPMAPKLEVDRQGFIQYTEVPRAGVKDMADYVSEMEKGHQPPSLETTRALDDHHHQMRLLVEQLRAQNVDPSVLASMQKLLDQANSERQLEQASLGGRPASIQPYIFLRFVCLLLSVCLSAWAGIAFLTRVAPEAALRRTRRIARATRSSPKSTWRC